MRVGVGIVVGISETMLWFSFVVHWGNSAYTLGES